MRKIVINQILDGIDYIDFVGNNEQLIQKIDRFDEHNRIPDILFWCNDKNLSLLYNLNYGSVICSNNIDRDKLNKNCNYIIVENPRLAFQQVLEQFFVEKTERTISKFAHIHTTASIGANVFVGNNVIIEENTIIGDNCIINHNTVILKNTIIGNNVVIGANNTIGGVGFGYEKDIKGQLKLIPHIGNVEIEDNVEIGNNTCIDRAVLGRTILRENVKVDNLVHIAHGVDIGKNSVVIANAMIAGSVKVGEDAWIAPSSSVLNQKSIGKNTLVGIGAVVLKDVVDNEVVVGNPAKPLNK